MRALAIAATGMNAQQTNVEVIANNIANINTTGFKRSRAEFTDLLYQVERAQGVQARGGGGPVPEGAQVGLGTRLAAVRELHQQGSLSETGNKLDVAINGQGWFQVQGPNGEAFYTRDGAFNTNDEGELVTIDGLQVVGGNGAITVPEDAASVTINESGEVVTTTAPDGGGAVERAVQGQLQLVDFANDVGLEAVGKNLFRETAASGAPVDGLAGEGSFGTVMQGYLEDSNVDPVKEISEMISAQRAYEMNSKVMTAADEMARTVATGIR